MVVFMKPLQINELDTLPDAPDGSSKPLRYWEYCFENHPDFEKWYWISFPILDAQDQMANRAHNIFKALSHVHLISIMYLCPPI